MRIVKARQISQLFFFLLFVWFCVVASVGETWFQLRGWPVNWFLQLDPLVALGTILTTGTLYAGLLWALVTVMLTIILGRFFCGWVCPFGTVHHFVAFLGNRRKRLSERAARNQYHPAQSVKYILLVFLLGAAAVEWMARPLGDSHNGGRFGWVFFALLLVILLSTFRKAPRNREGIAHWVLFLVAVWALLAWVFSGHSLFTASLQTGLLDPITFLHRSLNLVILPLVDGAVHKLAVAQRHTEGAWFIGALFLTAVLLNLRMPRFYCRFVCPLGALFGILGRYALWRVGKGQDECSQCAQCDAACEGACTPSDKIRTSECVLCMKCLEVCGDDLIGYRTWPSASGEMASPGLSRRGFVTALVSGAVTVPMVRLGGVMGSNWAPQLIRPPGALPERDFLTRCIKCSQCMRVCPTNVIHPAVLQGGLEGFWTPVLNFRVGTSGCQYNCVACGHVCPTAAIRPMTLGEKQGTHDFVATGPIRLGTAFVDRGRCLPWAMDRPCIVCQENCPTSPKAIYTREEYVTIRDGQFLVKGVDRSRVVLQEKLLTPEVLATGDYFCYIRREGREFRWKILGNTESTLVLSPDHPQEDRPCTGAEMHVQVRLKRPYVDPKLCIGCGICEHECPVRGLRAIRVTGENESRSKEHVLLLQ